MIQFSDSILFHRLFQQSQILNYSYSFLFTKLVFCLINSFKDFISLIIINDYNSYAVAENFISSTTAVSKHMVVCPAAQENGAHANGSEYIKRNNKVAIFTHS